MKIYRIYDAINYTLHILKFINYYSGRYWREKKKYWIAHGYSSSTWGQHRSTHIHGTLLFTPLPTPTPFPHFFFHFFLIKHSFFRFFFHFFTEMLIFNNFLDFLFPSVFYLIVLVEQRCVWKASLIDLSNPNKFEIGNCNTPTWSFLWTGHYSSKKISIHTSPFLIFPWSLIISIKRDFVNDAIFSLSNLERIINFPQCVDVVAGFHRNIHDWAP